jgi:hypothetical protein
MERLMVTKRVPIHRPARTRISPEALDMFRRMKAVEREGPQCEEWHQLNCALCRVLQLKPWQFPALVHPDAVRHWPASPASDPDPWEAKLERYRALEATLAEQRRARKD